MAHRILAIAAAGLVFGTAASAMEALDTNGDGVVSYEEMLAAVPTVTEEAFITIDTNGDGTLDADEYAAAEAAGTLPMANDG